MEIFVIAITSFFTAMLTFFSGFGLGTILMPVFAIFFPVDLAIALTGIVHFFNNLFKLGLVGKKADRFALLRFGLPAVAASLVGAWLLLNISALPPLFEYTLFDQVFQITPVKFAIAVLLIIFSLMDISPVFQHLKIEKKHLPFGGLLSGFFGGLSGHQGALRSAFLIKSGLSKEQFIATAVVISCFVDFTRISVYATKFFDAGLENHGFIVMTATLSAIAGAFTGRKLLKKVTLGFVQKFVAVCLILIALGLGAGWI